MRGQRDAPAALTPGKEPVPIVLEAGWAPGPVWTGAKNLAPPVFNPRTIQPVASRYTDWAIRAHGQVIRYVLSGEYEGALSLNSTFGYPAEIKILLNYMLNKMSLSWKLEVQHTVTTLSRQMSLRMVEDVWHLYLVCYKHCIINTHTAYTIPITSRKSRHDAVRILTGLNVGLPRKSSSIPGSPKRPDQVRDPPSALFNMYWRLLPGRGVGARSYVVWSWHLTAI